MSITVSDLNNLIRELVTDIFPSKVTVIGEASNVKISNNNLYLTLKDSQSTIQCAYWKFKNSPDISNGEKIEVTGRLSFYSKQGTYNINIFNIKKLEEKKSDDEYTIMKKICDQCGYFDQSHKKKIPEIINTVGIITALEGAALQDVLYVLKKNNFKGNVIIKKTFVQGTNCPDSVINSIKYFNDLCATTNIDVLLITRGGGSFEDLFGFSNFDVVKEIYDCPIFTISAVGHEIDFMLSDFVADYRAPTPSVAAEIISPKSKDDDLFFEELRRNIIYIKNNKRETYSLRLRDIQNKYENILRIFDNGLDEINKSAEQLFTLKNKINEIKENNKKNIKNKLEILSEENNKYDINIILGLGYVLLIDEKTNTPISSIKNIKKNQKLKLKMIDGEILIKI